MSSPEAREALTETSEQLIRDWERYPDAIDASELSARLWLIERQAAALTPAGLEERGEGLDVERVHRITCKNLIDHEPGSDKPYLWPCTAFAREYGAATPAPDTGAEERLPHFFVSTESGVTLTMVREADGHVRPATELELTRGAEERPSELAAAAWLEARTGAEERLRAALDVDVLAKALHEAVIGCATVEDIGGECVGPSEHVSDAGYIITQLPIRNLDADRLARAIHSSNEHPNLPGCLDMDRQTATDLIIEYSSGGSVDEEAGDG